MMSMNKECQNCGNTVSNKFSKVYGDNNGTVHHCLECLKGNEEGGFSALRSGAGARSDIENIRRY